MKIQWFWNRDFEYLMTAVGEWLGSNGTVEVVSTDFKCLPDASRFYFFIIYR